MLLLRRSGLFLFGRGATLRRRDGLFFLRRSRRGGGLLYLGGGAECACPKEDYTGKLMETILREALFDYMAGADKPGYELRQLLQQYATHDPDLSERIYTLFQLARVRNDNGYINGFTDELLRQSEIDLGTSRDSMPCLLDEKKIVNYPCSRACPLFGDCVTKWYQVRKRA